MDNKKYFVISDVHGYYDIMIKTLNNVGFDKDNPNHVLVSCGDIIDRGDKVDKCIEFVNSIPNDRKILIRGNHELYLDDAIKRGRFYSHDWHNRATETTYILTKVNVIGNESEALKQLGENELWNKYYSSLVDYYELGDNIIFVHGWLPCEPHKDTYRICENWKDMDFRDASYTNGMKMWNYGAKIDGKEIVCGHFHTSWGHSHISLTSKEFPNYYSNNKDHRKADFSSFIKPGIAAIDACTAYSGKMNCLLIEQEETGKYIIKDMVPNNIMII